jgi:multiple sugar transport system permease protein
MWISPRVGYALILPVTLLLFFVIVVPELWGLWASFQDVRLETAAKFVGADNYLALLVDSRFIGALLRNILYVAVTLGVEFSIALPAALLLSRQFKWQGLWLALIIAPYAVSNVVGVAVWRHLLLTDTGFVNAVITVIGLPRISWLSDPNWSFVSVVMVSVWRELPFVLVIMYAALLSIPGELKEAARIDGAGPLQQFTRVIFPLMLPAVLVAVVFRLVFAFRQFDIVWLLTQGGPGQSTELLSIMLYRTGFRYGDLGVASAVAWIMTIVTLVISYWAIRRMYGALWRSQAG